MGTHRQKRRQQQGFATSSANDTHTHTHTHTNTQQQQQQQQQQLSLGKFPHFSSSPCEEMGRHFSARLEKTPPPPLNTRTILVRKNVSGEQPNNCSNLIAPSHGGGPSTQSPAIFPKTQPLFHPTSQARFLFHPQKTPTMPILCPSCPAQGGGQIPHSFGGVYGTKLRPSPRHHSSHRPTQNVLVIAGFDEISRQWVASLKFLRRHRNVASVGEEVRSHFRSIQRSRGNFQGSRIPSGRDDLISTHTPSHNVRTVFVTVSYSVYVSYFVRLVQFLATVKTASLFSIHKHHRQLCVCE